MLGASHPLADTSWLLPGLVVASLPPKPPGTGGLMPSRGEETSPHRIKTTWISWLTAARIDQVFPFLPVRPLPSSHPPLPSSHPPLLDLDLSLSLFLSSSTIAKPVPLIHSASVVACGEAVLLSFFLLFFDSPTEQDTHRPFYYYLIFFYRLNCFILSERKPFTLFLTTVIIFIASSRSGSSGA